MKKNWIWASLALVGAVTVGFGVLYYVSHAKPGEHCGGFTNHPRRCMWGYRCYSAILPDIKSGNMILPNGGQIADAGGICVK